MRSNESILKEISPEYSLEGLMVKLKPQTLAIGWDISISAPTSSLTNF